MSQLRSERSNIVRQSTIEQRQHNVSLPTCFPVNPWQMTRVSLLIHTLALADMERTPTAELPRPTAKAATLLDRRLFIIISLHFELSKHVLCLNRFGKEGVDGCCLQKLFFFRRCVCGHHGDAVHASVCLTAASGFASAASHRRNAILLLFSKKIS